MLTPYKLVFTFGSSYVCANYSENQLRNVTMKVHTVGYTDADRCKPVS